jgi:multidrug efflux pump subunit AcrA (membrane-fusion protein)
LSSPEYPQDADVPSAAPTASAATNYSAGTGRRLKLVALGAALVLFVAFLSMHLAKSHAERGLARDTVASASAAPLVEVVSIGSATAGGTLTLPAETAAWYESLIFARVSGYVGAWSADIGDRVQQGQVLASIETPELDADYLAAKAKLTAAEAQVKVRHAQAEFAASTYARWRDSPKGVVSDQEREDKKAGEATSTAELAAARAQVNLARADVERLAAFEQF